MKPRSFFFLLSFFLLFSPSGRAMEGPFDHSVWDQFLKKFVNEKGEVDYAGVKKDPVLLKTYLQQLLEAPQIAHEEFKKWPREESLAFWMNAYHAGVIELVREYYPVDSINDIAGVWERQILSVKTGDRQFSYSLNQIRQNCLLSHFRDEKIHTALACGARSCPRLLQEAYTGAKAEGQLFLAAREFVNSEHFNKIIPGGKKVWLSPVFKWYGRDFKLDFGTAENDRGLSNEEYAVLSFIFHYLEDSKKVTYLEEEKFKIKYLTFDWSLNEWVRNQAESSAQPASK